MQKLWPVKVTVGKMSETVSDTDSRQEKLTKTVSRVGENLTKLDETLKTENRGRKTDEAVPQPKLGNDSENKT